MSQVEKIGSNTDTFTSLFTNFDGKFKGRLNAVIPSHIGSSSSSSTSENAPISAKYDCRVKVEYHKDIMTLVEEGMVLAVKNFKASSTEKKNNKQSYTLLVISRIWPDHYGLKAISDHTY